MIPSNCVFYLNGTKEYTKKWKPPVFNPNEVEIVDGKYTTKTSGRVAFSAKKPIKNNTKAFTITCFVKRNVVYSGCGEIGFFLDDNVSYDCGFYGSNCVYLDDYSARFSWAPSAETIMNGNYTDRYFFAFCREEDGITNHLFLNGKLVGTTNRFSSKVTKFTQISLFDADNGGSIVGWIDKVIIHRDICMYKEDFTPPNYDTDYNFDVDFSDSNDYMKLY